MKHSHLGATPMARASWSVVSFLALVMSHLAINPCRCPRPSPHLIRHAGRPAELHHLCERRFGIAEVGHYLLTGLGPGRGSEPLRYYRRFCAEQESPKSKTNIAAVADYSRRNPRICGYFLE